MEFEGRTPRQIAPTSPSIYLTGGPLQLTDDSDGTDNGFVFFGTDKPPCLVSLINENYRPIRPDRPRIGGLFTLPSAGTGHPATALSFERLSFRCGYQISKLKGPSREIGVHSQCAHGDHRFLTRAGRILPASAPGPEDGGLPTASANFSWDTRARHPRTSIRLFMHACNNSVIPVTH
jgi:hypothetical protein